MISIGVNTQTMFIGNALRTREIQSLLETFKYKEGYRFKIERGRYDDSCKLIITMLVRDSDRSSDQKIPIHFEQNLPPLYDPEGFWHFLRMSIYHMEQHEVDEWFTVNGQKMFDPHKQDRKFP